MGFLALAFDIALREQRRSIAWRSYILDVEILAMRSRLRGDCWPGASLPVTSLVRGPTPRLSSASQASSYIAMTAKAVAGKRYGRAAPWCIGARY